MFKKYDFWVNLRVRRFFFYVFISGRKRVQGKGCESLLKLDGDHHLFQCCKE